MCVYSLTQFCMETHDLFLHLQTRNRDQDLEKDVLLKRGYVLVYPDPLWKPPKGLRPQ